MYAPSVKGIGAFADVAPERADADQGQLADGAILYQLARLDDWRVVQEVFRGPVERGRAAGGLCHAPNVLDRAGGRFLARDVLARLEAGDGLVGVQEGRRQEFHGVDAVVGQDVVVAGVYARRYSPLPGAKLGSLRHGVAQRGDLAPLVRQVAGRVELRDRSAADYGEAYFVHGWVSLSGFRFLGCARNDRGGGREGAADGPRPWLPAFAGMTRGARGRDRGAVTPIPSASSEQGEGEGTAAGGAVTPILTFPRRGGRDFPRPPLRYGG